MRAIRRQRETFCYRIAAEDEKKKKPFDLNSPFDTKQNLNAQPAGWNPDKFNNVAEPTGPRVEKMEVTQGMGRPGQSGSGSAGSNTARPGGGSGGYQGNGKSGRDGLNPAAMKAYDEFAKEFPGLSMGGFNPVVDQPWDEHATGDAFDIMTSDLAQGNAIRDRALQNPNAKHVIWQQQLWYPGGGSEMMDNRFSPTENHMDHVHINLGN